MDYKKMWIEFYAKISRSKKATFTKTDIQQMMTEFELSLRRKEDEK